MSPDFLDRFRRERRLLVGTNNAGKRAELAALLAPLGVHLLAPADCGLTLEPAETGATYEANAIAKARAFSRAAGLLAAADDSGLAVDALGGAPGVHSARYAGPGCTYADNNRKLLAALAGVPDPARGARFCATMACCAGDEVLGLATGSVAGRITDAPRGAGGFGYDPVFLLPEFGRTMAELTPDEKNRVSHRARAARALSAGLARLIAGRPFAV